MARSNLRPRPAKKIQSLIWDLSSGTFSALSAGSAALNFSSVGSTPTTLLRIRGEVTGYIDAASAPGKLVAINYGIILVPESQGTTVIWNPVGDATAPWLLYGTMILGTEEMVTDVVDVPGISSRIHSIDNKAMRRIRPDVEMQFVVENTTLLTASSVNLSYSLRWLQGF